MPLAGVGGPVWVEVAGGALVPQQLPLHEAVVLVQLRHRVLAGLQPPARPRHRGAGWPHLGLLMTVCHDLSTNIKRCK